MISRILCAICISLHSLCTYATALDNWHQNSEFTKQVGGLQFENGIFFISNDEGLFASPNMTNWGATPVLKVARSKVAYGNRTFVAASQRSVATSSDGFQWVQRTLGSAASINAIAFGNGKFVATGSSSSVWLSEDGVEWSPVAVPEMLDSVQAMAFHENTFKAVGANGSILKSADGVRWEKERRQVGANLNGIAYGNGKWIVVGNDGQVLVSSGADWQFANYFAQEHLKAVAFAGGNFVVVGAGSLIWTSRDGTNFLGRNAVGNVSLNSVIFANGVFIAGGDAGLLISTAIEIQDGQPVAIKANLYPGISFTGQIGMRYTVQVSDRLQTNWTAVGSLLFRNREEVWYDSAPADKAEHYYRVSLDPRQ